MTIFPVIQLYPIYNLTSKQSNKHILDELGYKQDEIWSKGLWQMKNKQEPSMVNAFHVYYEFSYNEKLDVYVYTFVRPYDD